MKHNDFIAANETIVYEPQISKAIYLRPAIYLMIAIVLYIVLPDEESKLIFGIAFAAIALIRVLAALLYQWRAKFYLTNNRLIALEGIIGRKTTEVVLKKCEGITYDQGLFGRLFNYGTIKATTGGVRNTFDYIKDPDVLRKKINEQIDLVQQ